MKIKYISLLLLSIGFSTLAFAHADIKGELDVKNELPTPQAMPSYVTIPVLAGGWAFTAEAAFLNPTDSDIDNGSLMTTTSPLDGNSPYQLIDHNIRSAHPNTKTGFKLGMTYVFPQTANDIQLNWTHFRHGYSKTITPPTGSYYNSYFNVLVPVGIATKVGDGSDKVDLATLRQKNHTTFRYDAMDADLGQYINIGSQLQFRLFAGARVTYLQVNNHNLLNVTGYKLRGDNRIRIVSYHTEVGHSRYRGAGPRVGIDSIYNLPYHFSLNAHIAGALLMGYVSARANSITYTQDGPEGTTFIYSLGANNNRMRVVPAFDGKLGVGYTQNVSQSLLRLEMGYELTHYTNALDSVNPVIEDVSKGLGNGVQTLRTTSSIGFAGPYLTMTIEI